MGLTRRENWATLLYQAIEDRTDSRFVWGEFDCCLFAAECVEAITGVNVMPDVKYKNQKEAVEVIQSNGGLSAMVTSILGPSRFPLMASRGDVVMRHDDATDMMSLGVCVGSLVAFPAMRGVSYVNLSDCICSWKVG